MKKLALALATTAALGFAAPAFAADNDMSGTKAQTQAPAGQSTSPSAQTQSPNSSPSTQAQSPSTSTQTPSAQNPSTQAPSAQSKTPSMQNNAAAQTELKGKAKSKVSAKANKAKMAHHRRGTAQLARHGGFKRGHYYAYVKPHHKAVRHHNTTMQH